jgi:DNA mismatch endonuclease, patch repair protein
MRRVDPLGRVERSIRMSRVRSRQNKSTEVRVAKALRAEGIRGWLRHANDLPGRPDFSFRHKQVAVFVDGCFWHGCRTCCRRLPSSHRSFWRTKIQENVRRDRRVSAQLRARGWRVLRVKEHELQGESWLRRVNRALHAQVLTH